MSVEAQQFLDRLTVTPPAAVRTLYEALIDGLVSDGVWDTKLTALYVFMADQPWGALTNLINRYYYPEIQGAPDFELDHTGFKGTGLAGTADFLNTQYNPSTMGGLYTRNDASLGVFMTAGGGSGTDSGGAMGQFTGQHTSVYPRYSDDKFYWLINDVAPDEDVATASSTGMFSLTRSGANAAAAYRNGVSVDTTAGASEALVNQYIRILQSESVGLNTTSTIGAAFMGAALTAPEHLALYNRLNTFFTAVNGVAGSANPIVIGSITSTIVDDSTYNATPGIIKLQSGTLFCCYSTGTSEGVGTIWKYKTSADNGAAWSAATTLYTPPAGDAVTDVEVMQHSDGTIIVTGGAFLEVNQSLSRVVVLRGAADLSSWSSPIVPTISIFIATPFTASRAYQLESGDLLLPVYGLRSGDSKYSVGIIRSTDIGLTWSNDVVVIPATAVEQYDEAGGAVLGQRIVLIARHDISAGEKGYVETHSTDGGDTWSAAVQVISPINDPGKPATLEIQSGTQRIFMWARFTQAICSSRWGASFDAGVNWSPFTPMDNSLTLIYTYASACMISPTVIGSALARRRTATDSYIIYRDFAYTPAEISGGPLVSGGSITNGSLVNGGRLT